MDMLLQLLTGKKYLHSQCDPIVLYELSRQNVFLDSDDVFWRDIYILHLKCTKLEMLSKWDFLSDFLPLCP